MPDQLTRSPVSRPTVTTPRTLTIYTVAIAGIVAAVLLRYLLDPWMGDTLPLVTLFGAVAAAAWVGGIAPAVAVVIIGFVACDFLFIQPRHQFSMVGVALIIGMLAYFFTCGLIITFGEAARRAQARANERRELLRVTLLSIGDAVITTDVEARVTSMNSVAETLTGWTLQGALGRPLDDVFRIINEETRRAVANPAVKA